MALFILLILFTGCGENSTTKKVTRTTSAESTSSLLQDFDDSENNNTLDINTSDLNTSDTNTSFMFDDSNETMNKETNNTDIADDEDNTSTDLNTTETVDVNETNSSDLNMNDVNLSMEPLFHEQWYLARDEDFYLQNNIDENASIHAKEMLKEFTGKGVTIAIIDDGLDVTHEDLNGSIVATYDIETRSSNVSHNRQRDYHGTAITGIIAANLNGKGMVGIARESNIVFLKHKPGMSDSETIELFMKAEELGADVINCSWGTYDVSPSVKETIQELARNGRGGKGTLIVFAVGNDAREMGNDESAIPEVIAVGSTDRENLRAWYSNFGENLDVVAPGGYEVGITTLDPMEGNGVATLEENYLLANDSESFIATSPSAAIVSAALALLLEKEPDLTREEVVERLKNSSDKVGTLEYEEGWNRYYGFGKVNVKGLLGD